MHLRVTHTDSLPEGFPSDTQKSRGINVEVTSKCTLYYSPQGTKGVYVKYLQNRDIYNLLPITYYSMEEVSPRVSDVARMFFFHKEERIHTYF